MENTRDFGRKKSLYRAAKSGNPYALERLKIKADNPLRFLLWWLHRDTRYLKDQIFRENPFLASTKGYSGATDYILLPSIYGEGGRKRSRHRVKTKLDP